MGLGANFPKPNDEIVKKLVLDFARNSTKEIDKSVTSTEPSQSDSDSGDSLTVVRETEDGYVVRITQSDKETGEKSERKDFISRESFDASVRSGHLTKIEKDKSNGDIEI